MTAPSPRGLVLLVGIVLASCAGGAPGPDARPGPAADARWTVRIQGNDAGEMTLHRQGDQEVWHFTFNDRGRGPDLTTRTELDDAGMPVATRTEGHDYLKAPVEETFVLDGTWSEGEVRWRGPSESGSKGVEGPAFYLGTQSAAPEVALLARALIADPDGRIALLPEGEAVLDGRTTVTVTSDDGGTPREVTRVSIAGLGLAPTGVWLDLPDGDGSFFGLSSGWFSMLPPGWTGAAETLQEVEDEKSAEWAAALASRLGERPDVGIALVGASVFDPATGEVTPGRTVVIEGNRIAAVGADGEVEVPAGARRIDARGKTVLPGLWDMHTHVTDLDGVLHLAAGVTTVRDLANDVEQVIEKRETWSDPEKGVGPRLILAGFLDGPGPFASPTKALVSTEEEALEWIERYHELGYEQIKVYSSLDPELLPFIAREAHARGMRLSGHVPNGITAREAVELGFDELQHVNFLFLDFWADEEIDTRTPARFTEVAARGAELDLDSPEVEAFLRLLADRGIEVDPTVAVFEGMLLGRPGTLAPGYAAIADRMPPQVRRGLLGGGLEPPEGMDPTYRASYRRMVEMVGRLYAAGVPIVAGTDDFAGFAFHRELELYAEAGIPAPEVLRIATLDAAEITGRADRLGTVEAGKLADLIVVDGDPAEDISDIRNVEWTIKDGILYDTTKLYQAVSIRP